MEWESIVVWLACGSPKQPQGTPWSQVWIINSKPCLRQPDCIEPTLGGMTNRHAVGLAWCQVKCGTKLGCSATRLIKAVSCGRIPRSVTIGYCRMMALRTSRIAMALPRSPSLNSIMVDSNAFFPEDLAIFPITSRAAWAPVRSLRPGGQMTIALVLACVSRAITVLRPFQSPGRS